MNYMMIDFDGPLLPSKYRIFKEYQKYRKEEGLNAQFCPYSIESHNLIAKYSNSEIVFSTNWALHKSDEDLKWICKMNGLDFKYHKNCVTPKRFSRSNRSWEILNWVDDYAGEGDKILVIDDDTTCRHIYDDYNRYIDNGYFSDIAKMDKKPEIHWIEVDLHQGFSWENFTDSLKFFDIDWEDFCELHYGIKKKTPEEKAEEERLNRLLWSSMI